jgi:hypothetical protein
MHTWDSLRNRWDRIQSEDLSHNQRAIEALAGRVRALEQLVVYVVARSALGQPLDPSDPVLRDVFELGPRDDAHRALLEVVGQLQARLSPRVVTCPKCGAGVRDLPGVNDERCQFCGATVHT